MSLMVSLLMPAHSTQWSAWSEAGGGDQGVVDARDTEAGGQAQDKANVSRVTGEETARRCM
jgi:hypothetical protein